MKSKKVPITLDVVGLDWRVGKSEQERLAELVKEQPLDCVMEREPDNAHDENAVKILLGRNHIGYLRRSTAKVLAQGFDNGTLKVKSCVLAEVNVEHGWGRLKVRFLKTPASKPKITS